MLLCVNERFRALINGVYAGFHALIRLSMSLSIHVAKRLSMLSQSMRVAVCQSMRVATLVMPPLNSNSLSRGRAGSLSSVGWGVCLCSQVSRWIIGHRFIMMPQITSQNYKALG